MATNASDTQLMSQGQRRKIERNRPNIITYLKTDEMLFSKLQAELIVSADLVAKIRQDPSNAAKNAILLDDSILKLSQRKLDTFIQILEETDQLHVAAMFKYEGNMQCEAPSPSCGANRRQAPRVRPKGRSGTEQSDGRQPVTFTTYNQRISAEKWQLVIRDQRENLVSMIDWNDADFLESCKHTILTENDFDEILGKRDNLKLRGECFTRILREKTFNEFENFIQILKMIPKYKSLGMRIQHSALPNDLLDINIRKEIHDLIGEYFRMKRPSDRSFKEMEDALVRHYKGLRKIKVDHLCDRADERNIRAEGIFRDFSRAANESRLATKREEGVIGTNEAKQQCKEMENLMIALREDIKMRGENIEDRLNEIRDIHIDLADLGYIEQLHDKQNYLESVMEKMKGIVEKLALNRDNEGNVTDTCSQALDEEIRSLQNTSNIQAEQITRLLKDRNKQSKVHAKNFETVEEQIKKFTTQIKSLEKQNKELQKKIEEDEEQIEQLNENEANLNEQMNKIVNENDQLKEKNETQAKQNKNMHQEAEEAKEQIKSLERNKQYLAEMNVERDDEIRMLYERRREQEEEKSTLLETLTDCERIRNEESMKFDSKIESLQEEIEMQDNHITQITEENQEIIENIKQLNKECDELKKKEAKQSTKIKKLQHFKDIQEDMRENINYYRDGLSSVKNERREMQEDLEEEKQKCRNLQKENSKKQEIIEANQVKYAELEARNKAMKVELDKHRRIPLSLTRKDPSMS